MVSTKEVAASSPDFRRPVVRVLSYPPPLWDSRRTVFEHPAEEKGRPYKPLLGSPPIFNIALTPSGTSTYAAHSAQDGGEADWPPGCPDNDELAMTSSPESSPPRRRQEKGKVVVRSEEVVKQDLYWEDKRRQEDLWARALQHALDEGKGDTQVDLSSQMLDYIPSSIGDLTKMVSLWPAPSRLPLQKSQSVPPSSAPLFAKHLALRPFNRARSVSYLAPQPASTVQLKLFLSSNNLTTNSLSYTLFSVHTLHVLSLRNNNLDSVPPGIGRLTNLEELNVGTNQIAYLPAEITHLSNLSQIALHPNPWLAPPPSSSTSSTHRLLGPLKTLFRVPSLLETCTRKLLEVLPPPPADRMPTSTNSNPNLRVQDWAGDAAALPPHLFAPFATTLRRHSTLERDPKTGRQPFCPLSNVCRSPAHPDIEVCFREHAVERLEWVSEASLKKPPLKSSGETAERKPQEKQSVPILHRGCSANCLDWLEEEVRGDVPVEMDGFDLAEDDGVFSAGVVVG